MYHTYVAIAGKRITCIYVIKSSVSIKTSQDKIDTEDTGWSLNK